MRGSVTTAALAFAACLGTATLSAEPVPAERVSETMMRFHEAPSPERFRDLQLGMAASLEQWETDRGGVRTLAATFLARVTGKHGWPLLDLGGLDDQARAILSQEGDELARYVNDDGWIDPSKLDVWWSSYFATGDTSYLDRIAAQLRDSAETEADPTAPANLVAAAARWALTSNARQQPSVLAHLRSLAETGASTPQGQRLEQVILAATRPEAVELGDDDESCVVRGTVKVVTRDVTPGLDPSSFAARPKTLYRDGMHRIRLEEEPDPQRGLHLLYVGRDRDSWMVNLADGSGRHFVDHEANYELHAPLVSPDWPPALVGLEYGCELDFMKARGARPGLFRSGDLQLDEYAIAVGEHQVRLLVDAETGHPRYYVLRHQGETLAVLRYVEYSLGLKLPKGLFKKPAGIQYEDLVPAGVDAKPEE